MRTTQIIAAGVSTLALLAALPVSALSVSSVVTNATGVQVGGASSSAKVGINANVGVSDKSGASSSSASTSASANANLATPLVVTRVDLTSKAVTPVAITPEAVQTKADLSGYVAAQMQSNANLSGVDTASDHVAVTYAEPAMLFGFIPVSVETTATTDANGNVSISYPWWGFLAATNQTNLQASLQQNVDATLGTSATTSGNAQLSASQQAQLIATMEAAMQADASAGLSAQTNASASTQ